MNESACYLCGLSLPRGSASQPTDDRSLRFCCQGCRMVYTMLLESTGVDDPERFKASDLYRQCVAAGVIPAGEDDLRRIHESEETQSPTPGNPLTETESADTLALDLMVDGMWCPACAWVIEKTVSRITGVQAAACHFSTDRLRCRYRPARVAPDQIRKAVTRLGYGIRATDAAIADPRGGRSALIRLAVTALLSVNVMMLSWALYAGFFTTLSKDAVAKLSLPIVIMAVVVFVYGGGPMLRKAWFGLIHASPGMETLVGLGAGCAFIYSIYNWLAGSIDLYFDTACMLITLVLVGKGLEQQAKDRVRRDLDSFFALQPTKVRLITETSPAGRYVAAARLAVGDRFAVEKDEIVPADGRVQTGRAELDESSLTGEPRPVIVRAGDSLKSGSRVVEGRVVATAQKVGAETVLGRMIAIMVRSLEQKSAFESRTDHILRWFVPMIVMLAVATGLYCAMAGLSLHQAVVRAVTVMVISCPCALGVAIPMARLAGVSLAGRHGILVRDIEAFERAGSADTVVFDKTGTLTEGRWQLNQVRCEPGYDPAAMVALAAGLERASDHEIARSVIAYAQRGSISPSPVTDIRTYPDGVAGRLDKQDVSIGKQAFAWGREPSRDEAADLSGTPTASSVYLGIDGRPAARLIFGDTIRPTVPSLIAALKKTFRTIHLISGDGSTSVRNAAQIIGLCNFRGNLLPADKAAYIDSLRLSGSRVIMVGDGINDAAAMTRAHLAAAVYAGSGLAAQEAAHITFMRGDPAQLTDFLSLSRRVNRKVIQNLWCAWIYNLISIPVAMSGLLTPLVAATAMLLSSFTVIGNTLLLVRRE